MTTYDSGKVDYMGAGQRETAESRAGKDDPSAKTHSGVLVNLLIEGEPHDALKAYTVTPRTPKQIFAGHSPEEVAARDAAGTPQKERPVYLVFPDQATADAALKEAGLARDDDAP